MPALRSSRQPAADVGWFESPLALGLVQCTQREVMPLLTSHIGVRGLYLRPCAAVSPLLSGNMLQSTASLFRSATGFDGDLRCTEDALPIESDSLALIYALHALETAQQPAALIAECARTLQPEGVMFLIGLSTTSPWRMNWMGRAGAVMSERRLRGLLHEAGLSVEHDMGLGPVWPRLAAGPAVSEHVPASRWIPAALRAAVLLVVRKRRPGMTPIMPRRVQQALGSHAHAG